jgi:hypothetical protein
MGSKYGSPFYYRHPCGIPYVQCFLYQFHATPQGISCDRHILNTRSHKHERSGCIWRFTTITTYCRRRLLATVHRILGMTCGQINSAAHGLAHHGGIVHGGGIRRGGTVHGIPGAERPVQAPEVLELAIRAGLRFLQTSSDREAMR